MEEEVGGGRWSQQLHPCDEATPPSNSPNLLLTDLGEVSRGASWSICWVMDCDFITSQAHIPNLLLTAPVELVEGWVGVHAGL